MMNKMRQEYRLSSRDTAVGIRRGFVSTNSGALLTTDNVLAVTARQEREQCMKKLAKLEKSTLKEIKQLEKVDASRMAHSGPPIVEMKRRANRLSVFVDMIPVPRSIALRRAFARRERIRRELARAAGGDT